MKCHVVALYATLVLIPVYTKKKYRHLSLPLILFMSLLNVADQNYKTSPVLEGKLSICTKYCLEIYRTGWNSK